MKEKIAVSVIITVVFCLFHPVEAQQPAKMPRIGLIYSSGTAETPSPLFDAFRQGLRDLGYEEGKTSCSKIATERRLDHTALLSDLFETKLMIVATNNIVISAAQKATKTIPIVIVTTVDPVVAGYVKSFAQPGGNITGIASLSRDISAKRIELLKELLPRLSRAGILWDAAGPGPAIAFKEYEEAAQGFKFDLRSLEVRGPTPDLPGAFQIAKTARLDALIVVANPLMNQYAKQVFESAIKNRLPSITEERRYVNAGCVYGPNRDDLYRRAAEYG
jgi:putative ABC transport system substrate-binding protein